MYIFIYLCVIYKSVGCIYLCYIYKTVGCIYLCVIYIYKTVGCIYLCVIYMSVGCIYLCDIFMCYIYIYITGFLSGFGPRGGKTAICNLVGGHGSLNMHST